MTNIRDILKEQPCTCIDGRTKGDRISIPGGSFAILFTVLNKALEHKLLKEELDLTSVLKDVAANVCPIYYHSDEKSMHATLGEFTNDQFSEETLEQAVRVNSKSFVSSFLNNLGCGHLNLISKSLGTESSHLLSELTKAFWQNWLEDKTNFQFDSLEGSHEEKSVMIFNSEENWNKKFQETPEQHFAYHVTVEGELLKTISKFLVENNYLLDAPPLGDLEKQVSNQNEKTVRALASDLPIVHV